METLKNPIIFQCIKCNTIISDSFFLSERLENTLLFTDAPNTVVDEAVKSVSEDDSLCTYKTLKCLCGEEVGKRYLTAGKKMSSCLGKYSVYIGSIRGYQLGTSAEHPVASFMSIPEICAEISSLQKFCTYLYDKIKGTE